MSVENNVKTQLAISKIMTVIYDKLQEEEMSVLGATLDERLIAITRHFVSLVPKNSLGIVTAPPGMQQLPPGFFQRPPVVGDS